LKDKLKSNSNIDICNNCLKFLHSNKLIWNINFGMNTLHYIVLHYIVLNENKLLCLSLSLSLSLSQNILNQFFKYLKHCKNHFIIFFFLWIFLSMYLFEIIYIITNENNNSGIFWPFHRSKNEDARLMCHIKRKIWLLYL